MKQLTIEAIHGIPINLVFEGSVNGNETGNKSHVVVEDV